MFVRAESEKGLSLVEVLIALLIAGTVLTALLATLRAGIMAYRRLDQTSSETHEARLFITLLETELRNSLYYSEVPFAGEARQFSFASLLDEYRDDDVERIPSMVTYEYREKILYRKEIPLKGLLTEKEETTKKIIPALKSFVVKYAYKERDKPEVIWLDNWPKGQGLPHGVEVTLTFEKAAEKRGGKPADFIITRKFFIPQGSWGWTEKALS